MQRIGSQITIKLFDTIAARAKLDPNNDTPQMLYSFLPEAVDEPQIQSCANFNNFGNASQTYERARTMIDKTVDNFEAQMQAPKLKKLRQYCNQVQPPAILQPIANKYEQQMNYNNRVVYTKFLQQLSV